MEYLSIKHTCTVFTAYCTVPGEKVPLTPEAGSVDDFLVYPGLGGPPSDETIL